MALTHSEALGVLILDAKLNYEGYRYLSEWLGCHSYIPLADRKLDYIIVDTLLLYYMKAPTTAAKLFNAWLVCDMIESTLTKEQQRNILGWMVSYGRKIETTVI